ncbi:MAG: hypothetical protein HC913_05310 [Microscillaceae bacterium]|nr:hypothetical protein [Microscillaceae bacterium]
MNNEDRIFFRADDTADEIFDEDINYRETVTAGYLMGVIDTKFLQIVGGLRVEHTEVVSSPFVDSGEGFEPLDFKKQLHQYPPQPEPYLYHYPRIGCSLGLDPHHLAAPSMTSWQVLLSWKSATTTKTAPLRGSFRGPMPTWNRISPKT